MMPVGGGLFFRKRAGINLAEFQSGIRNGFKIDIGEQNMSRPRAANTVSEKSVSKTGIQSPVKRIYVFRCDESGLYAFTADRKGRMLPSQIYPQMAWRFEQTLTLRFDENSLRDQILRAALDGIAKRGFHLVHAAIYGELLGFTKQDIGTGHCLCNLFRE
jgi:hypothetical protein